MEWRAAVVGRAEGADALCAQFPSADILVNNVGASPSRNFLYMTDEDWQQLHELNLLSAVRCTRHCLPAMRKQHWGRVVMVATAGALYPIFGLLLSPMIASAAMTFSSVSVIGNALRLRSVDLRVG